MSAIRPGLATFNEMEHDQAQQRLRTCLDAPGWADRVLAGRPYSDLDQLENAMVAASSTITDAELEQALARHPRIGERADAARHDASHSTREQSGVDRADADVVRRLEDGNRAYEERFGRVFIIRAAGRSGPDILQHLRRRLDNSDEVERRETIHELVQIAQLRIREVLA
ncbi:2-oxo-4-hydroxy-4-carboxy-5-ureidoimidazoline decarboxylase [Nocardioides eburneiflavus]|uniref:2-oxo-4-hydroxy-4-carboxy-5-ureidoimidazoline decarboxylase n=1 Tax=Nocardioides eburneiflavus TaxID=2518372 RepID=A0A4Z1CAD8_9ACTN|nr:2-oxo-4-hydroxy-4-carboxy-5-ureidoimidazoline decarboxylase [Nocardioides eburneiflavus]TGN64426.1 2-oxo-4-hydroxy-4-carboxy-5-ureidoimidazoline decarboxylase [Nocardioides eburneiflavus]